MRKSLKDKEGVVHTALVGTIVPLLPGPYQSYTQSPEVALHLGISAES